MVVVLPEPLTPATRMTKGLAVISSGLATGAEHLLDLGRQHGLHLVGREPLRIAALAELVDDADRKILPEIGAHQLVFQRVERLRIEQAVGDQRADGAAERARGALEPAAQALPPVFVACCRPWRARDSRFGLSR